eukprot:COSAG01_NODE_736_length_13947_cov_174.337449_2_plen_174_part_00
MQLPGNAHCSLAVLSHTHGHVRRSRCRDEEGSFRQGTEARGQEGSFRQGTEARGQEGSFRQGTEARPPEEPLPPQSIRDSLLSPHRSASPIRTRAKSPIGQGRSRSPLSQPTLQSPLPQPALQSPRYKARSRSTLPQPSSVNKVGCCFVGLAGIIIYYNHSSKYLSFACVMVD